MSIAGMTMFLRRILVLSVIGALVISATAQLVPLHAAMADTSQQASMMPGCDQPMPQPAKHMPGCMDQTGCLCVPTLPAAPAAAATLLQWISIRYASGAIALSGRSLKPELLPPILIA
jgi:hypothetical protein